ncbi:MAG: heme exporter protein CcmB [Woeseia sp.]|nr:heme exporter protein CcmB [Woeseia sp.]|tara:strand:- start:598 stop:1290 length:693 start_codon:yes stop_codon:yes gene_type:complete
MSDKGTSNLFSGFCAVVRRDLLLSWKRPGDMLNPLFFFLMVCTLFPLAGGPTAEQLQLSGPGVMWVGALLATLLSLNSLFVSDYEDGSLDQLILSQQPLPLLALGKSAAHWLTNGVPLVLISPLISVMFQMPVQTITIMMVTLIFGTISLSLLGAIGSALTIGAHRAGSLLSLLILPLAMPILIFGARTASLSMTNDPTAAGIYFLGAYCMFALSLAPFATAAALRICNE